MFTLQTQVNLRRPAEPRPYRQRQAQPSALPLSDTIVLANLDRRRVHVAPPKCVQNAIDSWGNVWNGPRMHERKVISTQPFPVDPDVVHPPSFAARACTKPADIVPSYDKNVVL